MKFILLFIILINSSFEENIFVNLKKLSKEKYSVMLNNGLYIYNSKFSEIITDFEFSKNGITNYNNIILESYKEKYLICFINNKFIIYNADTNSIEDLTYKNYDQKFNNYYNLNEYHKISKNKN